MVTYHIIHKFFGCYRILDRGEIILPSLQKLSIVDENSTVNREREGHRMNDDHQ